jgi:ferredoxin
VTEQARGKVEVSQVEVNREECNGCGLCVESCLPKALNLSAEPNQSGVHPVQRQVEICSGCGTCYYFCPESGAITVNRDIRDGTCDAPAA